MATLDVPELASSHVVNIQLHEAVPVERNPETSWATPAGVQMHRNVLEKLQHNLSINHPSGIAPLNEKRTFNSQLLIEKLKVWKAHLVSQVLRLPASNAPPNPLILKVSETCVQKTPKDYRKGRIS